MFSCVLLIVTKMEIVCTDIKRAIVVIQWNIVQVKMIALKIYQLVINLRSIAQYHLYSSKVQWTVYICYGYSQTNKYYQGMKINNVKMKFMTEAEENGMRWWKVMEGLSNL